MQEKLLEELSQWHADARSVAQSAHKTVATTGSQLCDAVKFTERLLQCDITQILPVRQVTLRRLHTLSLTLPCVLGAMKCQHSIEFETDVSKFCAIVQAGFGHFANAEDSDNGRTSCCKMIDDSLSFSDETNSKVCASDCQ